MVLMGCSNLMVFWVWCCCIVFPWKLRGLIFVQIINNSPKKKKCKQDSKLNPCDVQPTFSSKSWKLQNATASWKWTPVIFLLKEHHNCTFTTGPFGIEFGTCWLKSTSWWGKNYYRCWKRLFIYFEVYDKTFQV